MIISDIIKRHQDIANESINLIRDTNNIKTAIGRYGIILKQVKILRDYINEYSTTNNIDEMLPKMSDFSFNRIKSIFEQDYDLIIQKKVGVQIKPLITHITQCLEFCRLFPHKSEPFGIRSKYVKQLNHVYVEIARKNVSRATPETKEEIEIDEAFKVLNKIALNDVPNFLHKEFAEKIIIKIRLWGYNTAEYDYLLDSKPPEQFL